MNRSIILEYKKAIMANYSKDTPPEIILNIIERNLSHTSNGIKVVNKELDQAYSEIIKELGDKKGEECK